MLSVSTLVLVIIMVAFLVYFYHNFIINDFDGTEFDTRLTVLREYLKSARNGVYPNELGYVSDVNGHQYVVTYINTANMTKIRQTTHDDREETFSFIDQTFNPVTAIGTIAPLLINTRTEAVNVASSISFHPSNNRMFIAHTDDGDVTMECPSGRFDGEKCADLPVCSRPDTILPMTEGRMDRLIYNKPTKYPEELTYGRAHPTLYVRCDENLEPHVEECEDGHTFQTNTLRCVPNPSLKTDNGVVTSFESDAFDFKTYGDDVQVSVDESVPTTSNVNPTTSDVNHTTFSTVTKSYGTQKAYNFNVDSANFNVDFGPKSKPQKHLDPGIDINSDQIDIKNINFRSKRGQQALEDGTLIPKRQRRPNAANAEQINELKTQLEQRDARNLKLQQTKMTFKNLTFDTPPPPPTDNVLINIPAPPFVTPVNDNSTHSSQPCTKYGAGYTFIDDTLSDNQYLECLDDSNLFLHTCTARLRDGSRYYCEREDVCAAFENGNGEIVHGERNDNVSFDTGRTVCRDYNVFEVVECDTGNFVTDIKFKHPLNVELHVNLPREVYDNDADDCLPFRTDLVNIHRDTFRIKIENPYDIDFGTMAVGRVTKMDNLSLKNDNNDLHSILTYARDMDEVALDPVTGVSVDCTDDAITVDLFSGKLYTLCNDDKVLIEAGEMLPDQYYDVKERQLARSPNYRGQCRIPEHERYVDLAHRTVAGIDCFYASPISL
ncbi:vp91/p95 [Spodoptera frugiperda granulovirus]|uniref:Vp91/p95 n=1 Tax=Spodoptera frugiperda granulovirus TaxID=307454 RepID=A0A0C5ASG5_9BBAC|nr:vp91/p95 [Spodoptera frugiperda granulovirus]AJK91762.1 vp91/p95 [Spodoptera frugiperda granulovirus]